MRLKSAWEKHDGYLLVTDLLQWTQGSPTVKPEKVKKRRGSHQRTSLIFLTQRMQANPDERSQRFCVRISIACRKIERTTMAYPTDETLPAHIPPPASKLLRPRTQPVLKNIDGSSRRCSVFGIIHRGLVVCIRYSTPSLLVQKAPLVYDLSVKKNALNVTST